MKFSEKPQSLKRIKYKWVPQESSSFEQRLTNIETRLENRINELKAEYTREKQALIERVKEVESRIPKPVPLLEALNTQDKSKLATI